MSSYNNFTKIDEEIHKLPYELIDKLEGVKQIKSKYSNEYGDIDIKKYIYKLIRLSDNLDIEKISIGILTLNMCYNITQEVIYKDYDLIYSYLINKEGR